MKKIRIEIKASGAPYPHQCWWRIVGSNGRVIVSSELMNFRNARIMIVRVIHAIKKDKFNLNLKATI